MDREQLDEIVQCLPRGRTLFRYFKDRYALMLLQYAVGSGRSVHGLKASSFAPLLTKPIVKRLLAQLGGGAICPRDLQMVWPGRSLTYRLTLGRWPRNDEKWDRDWHQMVRRGHNLVLQLNVTASHRRAMHRLLGDDVELGQCTFHPIAGGEEITLAWARLDIDLERGEALIEEIQSDWIGQTRHRCRDGLDPHEDRHWIKYVDRWLRPHARQWDETMLAAAVWFLRSELGLKRIFYYTFDTGNELKRLACDKPPRSLYTDLPRRFCFRRTHNGPLFLHDGSDRVVRKIVAERRTTWFRLDL